MAGPCHRLTSRRSRRTARRPAWCRRRAGICNRRICSLRSWQFLSSSWLPRWLVDQQGSTLRTKVRSQAALAGCATAECRTAGSTFAHSRAERSSVPSPPAHTATARAHDNAQIDVAGDGLGGQARTQMAHKHDALRRRLFSRRRRKTSCDASVWVRRSGSGLMGHKNGADTKIPQTGRHLFL